MLTHLKETISMVDIWLKKYGGISAIITGVVLITLYLAKLENSATTAAVELKSMNEKMSLYLQDRDKYERWNRQTNARLKRAFNRLGWEYEPVE